MNADLPPNGDQYCCPDEKHAISRAVHLGRLAAFYPACRQCPLRDDTGTISPRRVAQLAETSRRGRPRSLFHDEGAGGVYLNDLTPAAAKRLAAAFGAVAKPYTVGPSPNLQTAKSPNSSILLAGDGRPLTAELVAAAAEGLRSTGCDVVDLGPSTAACLAFAMHHLNAAGGVQVGNPGEDSHTVGMKFWTAGPCPLSTGGSLEPIIDRCHAATEPTARKHGELERFQADGPYIAEMAEHYHALRPLRVVVDSASKPTLDFLRRLAANVACEIIPSRSARNDLPQQIRNDDAHFAVCIDGDGETCRALDEQGNVISPERLLLLLAKQLSGGTIILEADTSGTVVDRLQQLGMQVVTSSSRRADMFAAMRAQNAMLGGGPSNRFWHADLGLPLPDALMTVTKLLTALSRGDDPLSRVLDRDAPLE